MAENKEPKGFLKGLIPSTFMDTHEEWHAALFGFCEGFMPWPRCQYTDICEELKKQISEERHYYVGGRVTGMISAVVFWILVAIVIQVWFW